MSEELKIALTALATTLGGTVVFVIGQIIQRLFIEPIQEQRKLIGEIIHALTFHANLTDYHVHFRDTLKIYDEAIKKTDEDKEKRVEMIKELLDKLASGTSEGVGKLRDLSSRIHQSIRVIPWYPLWEYLQLVPERDALCDVASSLIKWVKDPSRENTVLRQNEIIKSLSVTHFIRDAERRALIDKIEQE
jgi:hypothetical protein